jgi:hypothetical protein
MIRLSPAGRRHDVRGGRDSDLLVLAVVGKACSTCLIALSLAARLSFEFTTAQGATSVCVAANIAAAASV